MGFCFSGKGQGGRTGEPENGRHRHRPIPGDRKPDLHVFAKLFEECLEGGLEAQAIFLGVRLAAMTMSLSGDALDAQRPSASESTSRIPILLQLSP
jgi:hypothetical protein